MIPRTATEECIRRIKKISRVIKGLKRKIAGSKNSLKEIPDVAKEIYGLWEFCKQNQLDSKGFIGEIKQLNICLIECIKTRIANKYDKKRMSYGEILLNAYCDVLFYATDFKSDRISSIRPSFLKSPLTGRKLEYDIFFPDLKLALEFQGEQHYKYPVVMRNDKIKVILSKQSNICIIQINPKQMNSTELISLILNECKDKYGLGDSKGNLRAASSRMPRTMFMIIQRFDVAESIFMDTLKYLDTRVQDYVSKISRYSPQSANNPGPRHFQITPELNAKVLNKQIPGIYREIKQARKKIMA